MQQIEIIAEQFRLKTRLDECGDKIIPGKRGHLYLDNGALCLMVIDGSIVISSRWKALGGKLWLGDIGKNNAGRRVQDVKVTGIPEASYPAAAKLARCIVQRRLNLSPEQHAAVVARLDRVRPLQKGHLRAQNASDGR